MPRAPLLLPASAIVIALALWASAPTYAFDQYSTSRNAGNCADCHGAFRGSLYSSQSDGSPWTTGGVNWDLHDGHRTLMLYSDCNVCHSGTSRLPVHIGSSNGGIGFQPIGCVGCHGRAQDKTRGLTVPLVYGAGLRQKHFNANKTVAGISTQICAKCHHDANPALFKTVPENVAPPYYFAPDTAHPHKPTDPCSNPANTVGKEAVFGLTGLDNDGNGLNDMADPACAPARPHAPAQQAPEPREVLAGSISWEYDHPWSPNTNE